MEKFFNKSLKIVADEGAEVRLVPKGDNKIRIDINVDEEKEVHKVVVEKEKYLTIDLEADNSFKMPDSDVTITVMLKDKYREDKWCIEDFKYEPFVIGEILDEDSIVEFSVSGFSEKGFLKLQNMKDVVLPERNLNAETVEVVLDDAFREVEMKTLTVPGNYKKIYARAFKECNLEKITLNEGLDYIYDDSFEYNKLTELLAPKSLKYISKGAFKDNELKKVILNCTSVGPMSFKNNKIEILDLGKRMKRLYKQCFANNMLTEVNIPLSLKNGGYGALPAIFVSAFDLNPGQENAAYPMMKKVLLWTENKDNPNELENQGNYLVDLNIVQVSAKEEMIEKFRLEAKEVYSFAYMDESKYRGMRVV